MSALANDPGFTPMNAPLGVALLEPSPPAAVERMRDAFAAQRAAFAAEMHPGREARVGRLNRMLRMTEKYESAIAEAISADFGHRARQETQLAEIFLVLSGIRHARRHVGTWMRPRRVATPPHLRPARSEVIPQPLGVVGVISPWNYPFQLAMLPAVGALAAGNRVLVKPSELTPSFSKLLHEIVAEFFSPEELAVIEGDVEVGRAFSQLPFDHLFFTGSTAVGREVALAAAANLTPVTLELGGKSPAILDADCGLAVAAPRIAYGKLLNAGQTCVAPDYLLVARPRVDAVVAAITAAVERLYPTIIANPDYTSIVSARHYERLAGLVADAQARGARAIRIDPAGEGAVATGRKFPPTLLVGVDDDMAVMREEIFGPVLPIVPYDSLDEAIAYVNRRPRPLALYWFGHRPAHRDRVLRSTISGGVTINDVCWHVAQEYLPFGGVGASGTGAYHGEHSFRTFSKDKPVLHQARFNGFGIFRPPYRRGFDRAIAALKRIF
jgi:coniferyl-aldehyde dehydrogenase